MISFVPSTPIGIGLFLLILALGPKRGLAVLFGSMPFAAAAVFSASGVGNVVLPDFCAMAYVLTVCLRSPLRDTAAAFLPNRPGFPLLILCVIMMFGAYFLPQIFAGQTSVYAIQHQDGRAFISLVNFTPSGAQAAQAARFILGAAVFWAIASLRWQATDWHYALNAIIAASCAHLLVSLADWISYPLGLASLLDPIRTVFQAILVDQHFGSIRRLIGGHTEPASFGLYTIGLFGFWLRLRFGNSQFHGASFFVIAMAVLALRSTSSATIVNLVVFFSGFALWHWKRLSSDHNWVVLYVCVLAAMPAIFAVGVALLEHSVVAQNLANTLFFEKANSISGQERSSWNAQALQNFKDSYGFGLGIGSVRASGWLFAVLGNLGWPGALIFAWFLASTLKTRSPSGRAEYPLADLSGALKCACIAIMSQSILTTTFPNLGLPFFAMIGMAAGLDQAATRRAFHNRAPQLGDRRMWAFVR